MQTVRTIGLDIAKCVFRVHGVDGDCQRGYPPAVETRYSLRSCCGASDIAYGSSTMSRGRPLHSLRQRALQYPLLTPMMALWRR